MFHLYDTAGTRLKSFCFTEPGRELREHRIIRIFASDDYCYLLRITRKPSVDESDIMIVQINWDGDLIASYQLGSDVLAGTFFVDERTNKLYMTRIIEGEDNEIYAVTSYLLNQNV